MSDFSRTVAAKRGAGASPKRAPASTGDHEIDDRRHALRNAYLLGIAAWPGFFFLDLYICYVLVPEASLAWFSLWRFSAEAIFIAGYFLILRGARTHLRLTVAELLLFGVGSVALCLMAVRYGGINSRYIHGLSMVLLVRSAAVPGRWQRSFAIALVIALTFPLVLGIAAAFDDAIATQWRTASAVEWLVHDYTFVIATGFLGAVASHMVWRARQQVFEARRLGRYRLKARIAEGGMGEVWLARDDEHKRDVALKILASHAAAEEGARARFQREARAAQGLNSPHVIRVFDYGASDDGVVYFAMELLEGADLGHLVARVGPLPPARAVHFVRQACAALAEAHERGIVHRDIKPENLFATQQKSVSDFLKVLDFGIAKVVDPVDDVTLTRDGWLAGTPAYMAPEACTGQAADARSDVYSLGAVLYFLISGSPPFTADNAGALMVAHVQEAPVAPSVRMGKPVPAELERIILRCLSKKPTDRYPDATALDRDLANCDIAPWVPATTDEWRRAIARE
jgi:serine/threonine-protein kinase